MAAPQSPIGSRRRLGAELRRLRTKTGLTLDEVAEQMTCSTSKISRLETGKGIPKVPDVRELMRIYGVTSDTERDMLLRLVRDGREHGWWEPLAEGLPSESTLADPSVRYAGLETEARAVIAFENVVVHGLLQSPAYARAVVVSADPGAEPEEVGRLLELRRRRQEALVRAEAPLQLSVVLDESVLRRRVGSSAIMAEQLRQLSDMSRRRNVRVQILPFTAGVVRGHFGTCGVLEFPFEAGSDVVYLEGHAGLSYLESPSDVDMYKDVLADMSRRSLTADASRALIDRWQGIHQSEQDGRT